MSKHVLVSNLGLVSYQSLITVCCCWQPGEKKDDYWDVGKAQLSDPGKFLESLFKYDKDNISEESIRKIQPYIDNDDFTPAAIAKVCMANLYSFV